ncbi:GNAT family N-acetyltransferase [Paenibacillus sp. TRM 82003]|nr:GNAT family N-acetyltransferase [Paenibacillus sp. TRM 82003]
MALHIVKIERSLLRAWIEYAKKYRSRLDDSFLSDEELERIDSAAPVPMFGIVDEEGTIRGAVALADEAYLVSAKKARFRIFHAESGDPEHYESLWTAMKPYTNEVQSIFLFVREEQSTIRRCIESLSFQVERMAYVLIRNTSDPAPEPQFPEGFSLRTFAFDRDEATWCTVRNSGFARLKGSEAPMAPEHVAEFRDWEDHLEGGMFLLYDGDEAVGCVRVARSDDDDRPCAEIGPLALKPSHQGRGLGRALLQAAIRFGRAQGFDAICLSVNAENENAVRLYLKEGFRKEHAFVCYAKN